MENMVLIMTVLVVLLAMMEGALIGFALGLWWERRKWHKWGM